MIRTPKPKKYTGKTDVHAFIYNLFHAGSAWLWRWRGVLRCRGAFLNGVRFDVKGGGNVVEIGRGAHLTDCTIYVRGNRCRLTIGDGPTHMRNSIFWLEDEGSSIRLGNNILMKGTHIASTEGEAITIGDDVMFDDAEIRNGDSHAILLQGTDERINWPRPVHIGNHCWVASHVRILKGTVIADDCIIGNSAVCSGRLDKPHCIYSGNPARLVKEGIDWDRNRNLFERP